MILSGRGDGRFRATSLSPSHCGVSVRDMAMWCRTAYVSPSINAEVQYAILVEFALEYTNIQAFADRVMIDMEEVIVPLGENSVDAISNTFIEINGGCWNLPSRK